ncbi:hypothetical protein [Microvirga lotononidis]|uniref:Uncharacterized protein n=1 Tax=Microvirga lotononidis TaxID=864069 RepID=I4Z249_9HYPH|nr:hypothetical protein [Microvirga lotononidis]EIM30291.1 hypothetical protein MicloDRAFT_00010960 [Microvirga lotononidis]WQO31136.1 hypothetical protein U0023_33055 [Microvirga lotononidis]
MSKFMLPDPALGGGKELSLDEILARGREAAAATGQIITGDKPPAPQLSTLAPEPVKAPSAPVPPEPVRSSKAAGAETSAPGPKKMGRPPRPKPDEKREKWGVQLRTDFILGVRRIALDRRVSPFDVLEEAVGAYLQNRSTKRES